MAKKKSVRTIEMSEDNFLLLIDVKRTTEVLLNKFNRILSRHTVRDPAWRGQIVPLKQKRIILKEG